MTNISRLVYITCREEELALIVVHIGARNILDVVEGILDEKNVADEIKTFFWPL